METAESGVRGEKLSSAERYKIIDERNLQSFLLQEGSSLQVLQSVHSVGAPRDILTEEYADKFESEVVERAQKISRVILAGNMSPLNGYGPEDLTVEQRIEDAKNNISEFLAQHDVEPAQVRILRPERDYSTPLNVLNLDEVALQPDDTGLLRPDNAADMVYTYDPEIVIAARPADCPIVFISAETPKGEVTTLLHLAWKGVAYGYVQQAKTHLEAMDIDWQSARVQITPGGHAETYKFTNFDQFNPHSEFPSAKKMFVPSDKSGEMESDPPYSFGIDVAAEVYEQIIDSWDIEPYQIFADTTNTTAPESGYSSHSRTSKKYKVTGENSRDIVLARRLK
jgi:copper oxidase (laccase) domain-containing protein